MNALLERLDSIIRFPGPLVALDLPSSALVASGLADLGSDQANWIPLNKETKTRLAPSLHVCGLFGLLVEPIFHVFPLFELRIGWDRSLVLSAYIPAHGRRPFYMRAIISPFRGRIFVEQFELIIADLRVQN
jgi:hypothetical protein